uniref:DUF4704 domain-containing protein n=1 Tax=Macrostomum lignano TaxID=282301 RepID=A0A1I8FI88_9PLAT
KLLIFAHQSAVQTAAPASAVALRTPAPRSCAYISGHVVGRLAFLDGKNGQLFRDELGIRLYRCLVEHLHKFKYSLSGGLQALCDLTEYMACLKPVRHSGFLVDGHDLYDVLCKLLNLLVIQPANLHDICEEESRFDR